MQIRKNRSIILILILILFGVYFFVLSENGILQRIKLVQNKNKINNNINGLSQENKILQKEYSIISNGRANDNYYKEEASKSGFIADKDKYIFFKSSKKGNKADSIAVKEDKYPVRISQLRLIWIVSSIIILSLYIWKRNSERKREEENH